MQTLAALPDQDSFYDVTDCLEQQGMESIIQQHVASKGVSPDLKQQLAIYEVRAFGRTDGRLGPKRLGGKGLETEAP